VTFNQSDGGFIGNVQAIKKDLVADMA